MNAKGIPCGFNRKGKYPEGILKEYIRDQAIHESSAKTGLLFPRVYYSGGTGMTLDGSTVWGVYYFLEGLLFGAGVYSATSSSPGDAQARNTSKYLKI